MRTIPWRSRILNPAIIHFGFGSLRSRSLGLTKHFMRSCCRMGPLLNLKMKRGSNLHRSQTQKWEKSFMKLPERIKVDPEIMMGKPCVKDTRIPVYVLLQKMAAGETESELLQAYPQLSK